VSIISEPFLVACGGWPAGAKLYAGPLAAACDARGIAGADIKPFLANVLNESHALQSVIEDTFYRSAAYIREVFPSHFKSDAAAQACVENSARLADVVYNGWQGRGLPMLTGIANCTAYANAIGMPVSKIAAYLVTPAGAADSAAWFFVHAGCLRMSSDLLAITRSWEGGNPPIGWKSVQTWAGQVTHALVGGGPGMAVRAAPATVTALRPTTAPKPVPAAPSPAPSDDAETDALNDASFGEST
jgi:predicted chitinase